MKTETKTTDKDISVMPEQFHLENFGRTMFEQIMYNSEYKKIVILDFRHLNSLDEKESYSNKILQSLNNYDKLLEENKRLREALQEIKDRSVYLDKGVNSAADKQISEMWEISYNALK